jgi:hypothetical protein
MGTTPRLAAYAVALVVAFGAAFGLGRAVGPVDAPAPAPARLEVDGEPHQSDRPDRPAATDPSPDHRDHGSGS